MPRSTDLLQGSLDLLVLKALMLGPLHGWGISKRIRQLSRDILSVNQGSLYPALYRLEEKGLIDAKWSESPNGRRTKVYSVTASGRKHLNEQRENWERFTGALAAILRVT